MIKMKHLGKIVCILLFTILQIVVYGQEITINGTVRSVSGESLPGVSIVVKGTTTGTITNLEGNYSIENLSPESVLVFSFVGYISVEIQVGSQKSIDVTLEEDLMELDEIVVIGYGTQKKSDKTGAVANVSSDELNGGVLTDPIQGLQGKTAGVSITKKGGDPNSGFSVKVRGSSGLFSKTDPLFVVDGVPGVDPTTIAPEDIESFNVLKDASSTAIYGSRGANGVVMITTKKGRRGQINTLEFNTYLSMDQVANRLDMLSADDIRQYVTENDLEFQDGGYSTDWQDEIFRNAISQSYNLASSGGSENTYYRASLTHSAFEGVVIGSEKKRTLGRLNITQKCLEDKLTLSSNLAGTIENNDYIDYTTDGANAVLYQAYQRNPTDPVYSEDAEYYEISRDFNYYNPVALANQIENEREAKRYLANVKGDLEIIRGLIFSANLGYTRDDHESFYFEPTYFRGGTTSGLGRREYVNFESKIIETTLSYSILVNNSHNINAVAGYSWQEDIYDGFKAEGKEPQSDYVTSNNLEVLNNVNPGDIKSYKFSSKLISFFGRVAYNYNSKYYLTGTLRQDGSSRFGKNNEWGLFPSGSVAWNMKQEAFLENISFLSQLKLRAGYGLSGNQEIWETSNIYDNRDKQYIASTYALSQGTTVDPVTGLPAIEFNRSHNANPDLKWEENKELNVGLDFGLLQNKIQGSFEYYNKTTFDLIAPYAVPVPPNVLPTTWGNAGEISNSGIELNLQIFAVNKDQFRWKTTFNFSKNKQEVISLSSSDSTFVWSEADKKKSWLSGRGLVGDQNWTQYVEEGFSLGTFYLPEYAGINEDGAIEMYTEDGDVTTSVADAERRVVGTALPDFEIGWSNYFKIYKNIDVSFSLRAVYGHELLNVTRMVFSNPTVLPTLNALTDVLNEVDKGLTEAPKVSSYYIEDGSYIKIDNLTIGYNFNVSEIKYLSKFRAYFSSNNLLTITDYKGIDPEISYDGLEFGLDMYNVYPKTRTFTLGLQVTF